MIKFASVVNKYNGDNLMVFTTRRKYEQKRFEYICYIEQSHAMLELCLIL